MYLRALLVLVITLLYIARVSAQPPNEDCADAQLLCAQQAIPGNNIGATIWPGFCATTPSASVVWYTFNTNSVGGSAIIDIEGIDCLPVTDTGNMLSVIVLSGDGSCTPASFSPLPPCILDSSDFSVTTQPLLPNTQYWMILAGAFNGGATNPAQCNFNLTVSGPGVDVVGVDLSAGEDVQIDEGQSTQLNGSGPLGSIFNWSPTTGLSNNVVEDPIAAPAASTTYTVTTEIDGCTFTDEVNVQIIRWIVPPNTFTPNGDGKNDLWEIPGINDHPGAEVVIHDRWGQIVYRANGYREPWDGTNGGKRLPDGTYYYSIQLNQLAGRSDPYLGFISIVR